MLTAKNLIAGEWIGSETTFDNQPVTDTPDSFAKATETMVDRACEAASDAFPSYAATTRGARAAFLRAIATEIDKRGEEITRIGMRETGLPEARLEGERGRTCGQLRLFADHIEDGAYLDRRHQPADPEAQPPRPDQKMVQRPIGPVVVFGASNFPLAFSTAGGDTAAALAAGCPVVVRGHFAHPGVGDLVAQAIDAARWSSDLHPGVFSQVQGGDHDIGRALVQHPMIRAIAFTGSLRGGRALFDLCAARPEPIPFFGELGSINPVFLFPNACDTRGDAIAEAWADSLTLGAGQFCTNPGVVIVRDGPAAEAFVEHAANALRAKSAQVMLTNGIEANYHENRQAIGAVSGVETLFSGESETRHSLPSLMRTDGRTWLATPSLAHEVFGPFGLIVTAEDDQEIREIAETLDGQLTVTLQIEDDDMSAAAALMRIVENKAGRILVNGFPTGVDVSDAMVHGGPYPASTNFGATSVGTMAIRRFLRPVCYQDVPVELLPDPLGE